MMEEEEDGEEEMRMFADVEVGIIRAVLVDSCQSSGSHSSSTRRQSATATSTSAE